jgi:hypothetical protein
MQTSFDLLRRDPDGSFIWLEAAADLVGPAHASVN